MFVGGTWTKRYDVTKTDGTAGLANVTVTITLPDGTDVPVTPAFTTPNHYDATYATTQLGRHVVTASATGQDLGSFVATWPPDVFHVDSVATAVPLVGLDDAKGHLNITRSDTDAELLEVIAKASASIEARTQLWHRVTVTETRERIRTAAVKLRYRPAVSITSVAENGVTRDASTYQLGSGSRLRPGFGSGPFMCGAGQLVITYVAGDPVVPLDVRQAVLLLVEHQWLSQRGPARQTRTGTSDSEYDPRAHYSWPRRVHELLEPYIEDLIA